jgi:hypothetical protein
MTEIAPTGGPPLTRAQKLADALLRDRERRNRQPTATRSRDRAMTASIHLLSHAGASWLAVIRATCLRRGCAWGRPAGSLPAVIVASSSKAAAGPTVQRA